MVHATYTSQLLYSRQVACSLHSVTGCAAWSGLSGCVPQRPSLPGWPVGVDNFKNRIKCGSAESMCIGGGRPPSTFSRGVQYWLGSFLDVVLCRAVHNYSSVLQLLQMTSQTCWQLWEQVSYLQCIVSVQQVWVLLQQAVLLQEASRHLLGTAFSSTCLDIAALLVAW
jgi:hypothetical protein